MARPRTAVLLVLALTAVAGTAAEAAKAPPNRLPTAKPGRILPSAGGVVLGRTTKAQLPSRWGKPSYCVGNGCVWAVRRAGSFVPAESAILDLLPRGGFAHYLQFASASWRTSRLRGWSTREGIRIGSTYAALRKAYPKLRWNLGEAGNRERSNWLVEPYTFGGSRYTLRFLVDRGLRRIQSGHVLRIEVQWLGPPFTCKLAAEPAPGPQGEATGKRIHGSCSGAPRSWYADDRGNVGPIQMAFEPLGEAVITSSASPFDKSCSAGGRICRARASDWAFDVTLGFESPEAGVEVTVHEPRGYRSLRTEDVRVRFP